jgi:hypothetical protein
MALNLGYIHSMNEAQYTIIENSTESFSVEERKPGGAPSIIHGFKTGEAAHTWVKAQRQTIQKAETSVGNGK